MTRQSTRGMTMTTIRNRYVLRAIGVAGDVYIAPCIHGQTQITDKITDAEKFDDRDNLAMKCRFQRAVTGMEWQAVRI